MIKEKAHTKNSSGGKGEPGKYYQCISELPLHRFIECLVDGNLKALVIEGSPENKDLQQAWEGIQIEYLDAIKDDEYRLLLNMRKDLHVYEISLVQMEFLIDVLRDYYVKEFVDELNLLLGSKLSFDVTDNGAYERDLKAAWNRSRGTKIAMDIKQRALESLEKNQSSKQTQKPTREYFQNMLIVLSDHVKYQIPETITTWEFCNRIRRLRQYYDHAKLRQHARGRQN